MSETTDTTERSFRCKLDTTLYASDAEGVWDAYMCVDYEDRLVFVTCEHPAYRGTRTMREYHGRAGRWRFPRLAAIDDVTRVVEGVAPLIEELLEIYDGPEWDGRNHVGSWADPVRADELIDEIDEMLSSTDDDSWMDATEWSFSGPRDSAETLAREIAALPEGEREEYIEKLAWRDCRVYLVRTAAAVRQLLELLDEDEET